jgi:hypothetical protein
LPEPDKPVITTNWLRGMSRSMFFRLWVRSPRTLMWVCRKAEAKYSARSGSSGKAGESTSFTVGGQISKTFDYPLRRCFWHLSNLIGDNDAFVSPLDGNFVWSAPCIPIFQPLWA